MNKDIVAICVKCDAEFTEEQIKEKLCCPSCGTKSIPIDPKNDVNIKINTHYLRILGIWAENYAKSIDSKNENSDLSKTVDKIARLIESQLPSEKWVPLTLTRELIDLKENLGHNQKVEIHRNGKIEEI